MWYLKDVNGGSTLTVRENNGGKRRYLANSGKFWENQGIFSWSGEICTFQTKSVSFLYFLNVWDFVLLWKFIMCTWILMLQFHSNTLRDYREKSVDAILMASFLYWKDSRKYSKTSTIENLLQDVLYYRYTRKQHNRKHKHKR